MKTNPKIALITLITALAVAVFVWMYIKKGKAKKEAVTAAPDKQADTTAQLAVEPEPPIVEPEPPILEQSTTYNPTLGKSGSVAPTLEIASIELEYDPSYRAFDYTMNYEGAIVKGSYSDYLLPDYDGRAHTLLREGKNGVIFEVNVSSYSPSIGREEFTFKAEPDVKAVATPSTSTKGGAVQKGTTARDEIITMDKKGQTQRPNSVMLSISKGDQSIVQWKMVDFLTGEVYNGIKGFEGAGAAYKEGDLSKKVYYLD